ncbi:M35 family metallo-endopeptidase [Cupriavidus necator]
MEKRTGDALVSDDATDTERICPNMTNAEFRAHIMGLRDEALSLVANRLAELKRWSPADARWFVLWFGTSEAAARVAIARGLARMKTVLAALTPANFVRYSAYAMRVIGCVSREHSPGAVAEVCAPDTATHTIAIRLDFCTLRARHPRFDSQLLTLVHEVSHFADVLGSRDHWYSTHNAKDRAGAKDARTIENADNIAGYVVCSE